MFKKTLINADKDARYVEMVDDKAVCRSLIMLHDKKLENPWPKHRNNPL